MAARRPNGTSSASGVPSNRVHESTLSNSTASNPFCPHRSTIGRTCRAAAHTFGWRADVDQELAAPVGIVAEVVEDKSSGPVRALVGAVHPALVVLGLEHVDVTDRVATGAGVTSHEPVARHNGHAPGRWVVAADLVVEAGVGGRRRPRAGIDRHCRCAGRECRHEAGREAGADGRAANAQYSQSSATART